TIALNSLNNSPSQQQFQKGDNFTANNGDANGGNSAYKGKARSVNPQSGNSLVANNTAVDSPDANLSRVVPAEAEFRQLIGEGTDGMLARFLQNKLKLMFWHRLNHDSNFVFGAQLNLPHLINDLRDLVQPDPALTNEICVAILDDNARPVVISHPGFHTQWKRPFVATE